MFDEKYTNEKAQELIMLIGFMDGNRATDSELQQASSLCEESNRLIAEWSQTEDGASAIISFIDENEESVEGMYRSVQAEGPKAIFTESHGVLKMMVGLFVDRHPGLDGDLILRVIHEWQKFFLSHDHMERLMKLASVAA